VTLNPRLLKMTVKFIEPYDCASVKPLWIVDVNKKIGLWSGNGD
jgi:hypothetical protein